MILNTKESKWKNVSCLNGLLCLKIPEDWERPSEEMIETKFPYRLKPQEIYVSSEKRRILTFNLLEKQLQEKQVYAAIVEIQRMISHMYPESIQNQSKKFKSKAGMVGWFSFITGGSKGDECHCMFLMSVLEKMLFGSYHFPVEQMQQETDSFKEILKNIEIRKDIREENHEGRGIFRQDNTRP